MGVFVPGSESPVGTGRGDDPSAALLAELGLSPAQFASASKFVSAAYSGVTRPVALSTGITSQIEGNDVILEFFLGPGRYATTVCREFMKADPVRMI